MERQDSIQQFATYLQRRYPGRHTSLDYVSDVRLLAEFCPKAWREVSAQDIDAFIDAHREKWRPATLRRRVSALKTFFDFLIEQAEEGGWRNPVRFKRHACKATQSLPRDLSDEEVERLWGGMAGLRDRAWFVLMWRGGLRVGEVVDLRLDDVLSGPEGERPARLRVMGKGRKERMILLTAEAYQVLTAWLKERPTSPHPNIFLNERGQPLKANGILWLLHQSAERVGLQVTPHQLRHTFARQSVEAGMPLPSLSKLMGHAQLSTTQSYTAGADPELNRAYQSAMQRLTIKPSDPPAVPLNDKITLPEPLRPSAPPTVEAKTPSVPLKPLKPRNLPPAPDWDEWAPELPEPIRQACLHYVQRRLPRWRPERQREQAVKLLSDLRRFWNWQLAHRPITQLAELQLADLQAYQTERQAEVSSAAINRTLSYLLTSLREQLEAGVPVDDNLFRLRRLAEPERLPRYLPDTDYERLEAYARSRLATTDPNEQLALACFFVLAHAGLRAGECVYLTIGDLDLEGQRLLVRLGKGQKDRLVYLSELSCQALQNYLSQRERAPTEPLWVRANGLPIRYEWLHTAIVSLGQAAGVPEVTPHRLRHTLATRLINAGMDITRIQKLLGHSDINTTMGYARVLDPTIEADYHRAMRAIERRQAPLTNAPELVLDWPVPATAEVSLFPPIKLVPATQMQFDAQQPIRAIDNSL